MLNDLRAQILPKWKHVYAIPTALGALPTTGMVAGHVLSYTKQSKMLESHTGDPYFGSRILNEVAEILEAYIQKEGGAAVNGLQQLSCNLV